MGRKCSGEAGTDGEALIYKCNSDSEPWVSKYNCKYPILLVRGRELINTSLARLVRRLYVVQWALVPLLNVGVSQGSVVGAVEIASGGIMELDVRRTI